LKKEVLMNIDEFLGAAEALYEAGISLELVSAPGIGKSSAVADAAAALSRRVPGREFGLWTVILSAADAVDVTGMPVVDRHADGTLVSRYAVPALFPAVAPRLRVWRDGEPVDAPVAVPGCGIVFLDEFGQAPDHVRVAAAQFVLSGEAGQHVLPPGWRVWLASNRTEDRSGVGNELAMLRNRRSKLDITFDTTVFEGWCARTGVHPAVAAFSRLHANLFATQVPAADEPFCTPRTLALAMRYVEAAGERPDAMSSVTFEVVAGFIGREAAGSLLNVVALAATLPDISEVLADPEGAPLPESYGARIMLIGQLTSRAPKKALDNLMRFVERLPKELQILAMSWLQERWGKAAFGTGRAGDGGDRVARWLGDNAEFLRDLRDQR
jgi:limonene-1,2-epoxide hydrolase